MKKLFFLALLLFLPLSADAASLYLSPASLTLTPGQVGTFTVYVESSAQAMNAVSGSIFVNGATASGASKAGSIVSFWAAEPSAAGSQVSFEGVVLSPGYTGAAGKVLSFSVRAAAAGTYSANFISGSVLANDGKGTDITSGTRGGTITVSAAAPAAVVEEDEDEEEPASEPVASGAPTVRSDEFSSPDEWYSVSSGTFAWDLPSGVTAVRTLLDQNKSSVPSILLDGRTTSRRVTDIPEGVNYFHVQFKDAAGWGGIAHVRVAVDITPPSFTALNEIARSDATTPRVSMSPDASDSVSGLAGFEASVDGSDYKPLTHSGEAYLTAPLPPGSYELSVRAVDRAGNVSAVRKLSVQVEPIAGPVIESVTQDVQEKTPITVTGTAPVRGTKVHVVFLRNQEEAGRATAIVSTDGSFSATLPGGLSKGTYVLRAYVEDERDARSLEVEGGKVYVKGPPLDATILLIAQVIGALAALAAVVGVAAWLLLTLGVGIARRRTELMEELREADAITRKAFALLRKDVEGYADYLKRQKRSRSLTEQEMEFMEALEEDLKGSEQVIRKEIADAAVSARRSREKK